jgi:hypothetical protein
MGPFFDEDDDSHKMLKIHFFDKKLNNQRNCQKNLHKDESISQNEEWIT